MPSYSGESMRGLVSGVSRMAAADPAHLTHEAVDRDRSDAARRDTAAASADLERVSTIHTSPCRHSEDIQVDIYQYTHMYAVARGWRRLQ